MDLVTSFEPHIDKMRDHHKFVSAECALFAAAKAVFVYKHDNTGWKLRILQGLATELEFQDQLWRVFLKDIADAFVERDQYKILQRLPRQKLVDC